MRKVVTDQGWFAARPPGTEDVYKLCAGSFKGKDHIRRIQEEAQALIGNSLVAQNKVQFFLKNVASGIKLFPRTLKNLGDPI
jgi:Phosphoglucomutase/phosphomannomutase, C-terminal domain